METPKIYEANSDIDIPAITDDRLIEIANQAEKRIEAINKIKGSALRVTNKFDWVDQNGRPYLQASGAEKIARLFRISWRIDEPIIEHEEGGHFSYTCKGYFTIGDVTIEAIGTRSSKDGFFKKYDKEHQLLPPSEIDKGDVKKAAYTNCIVNGITRLLGIRNFTWDDLRQAGIIQEKITQRVNYRQQEKPTTQAQEAEKENVRDKFIRELKEYCEDDPEEMEKVCRQCSFFEKDNRTYSFGYQDIFIKKENGEYKIHDKWVGKALGVLRDLRQADGGGQG